MSGVPMPDWESKTELIRRTVAAGATSDEMELFLHMAKRAGLDPLARQIHFVKRRGKGVIQVGIDGLRLTADRTELYAGSDDPEYIGMTDGGYPAKSRVTVYKIVSGMRCPFTATAHWDEYYPGDDQGFMWRKMPRAMLSKCAEALALRKAFPADLSGLYIHEEMEQAGASTHPVVIDPPEAPSVSVEGKELLEATARSFGDMVKAPAPLKPEPKLVAPDGKEAYEYAPARWPMPRMFIEPMSDNQRKMMGAKARERGIDEETLPDLRREVLRAYGLEDDATKAVASLFIDWLIHVSEDGLDEALAVAEGAEKVAALPGAPPEPRPIASVVKSPAGLPSAEELMARGKPDASEFGPASEGTIAFGYSPRVFPVTATYRSAATDELKESVLSVAQRRGFTTVQLGPVCDLVAEEYQLRRGSAAAYLATQDFLCNCEAGSIELLCKRLPNTSAASARAE